MTFTWLELAGFLWLATIAWLAFETMTCPTVDDDYDTRD